MSAWPWQNGERFGPTHAHWRRCSECAYFRRGPAGDTVTIERAMKGRR